MRDLSGAVAPHGVTRRRGVVSFKAAVPESDQGEEMPSYDLVCKTCGHEFELTLHRFITDDDKVCPECGGTNVEQKLSAFEWRSTRWKPTKGREVPQRTVAKTRVANPKPPVVATPQPEPEPEQVQDAETTPAEQ